MLKSYKKIIIESGFKKLELKDIFRKKIEKSIINIKDLKFYKILNDYEINLKDSTKNDILFYLNMVLIFKVYPEIILNKQVGYKYIGLNNLVKNLYYSLTDYTNNFKKIKEYIEIIIEIFFESKLLEIVEVKKGNFYKNIWCLRIEDYDYYTLYDFKKNFDIFITHKNPYKWILKDNDKIINQSFFESDNIYEFISLNSIFSKGKMLEDNHITSTFSQDFIEYINKLQSIPFKFEKEIFLKIFSKYQLSDYLNFDNIQNSYEIFLGSNYEKYILKNEKKYYTQKYNNISNVFKYIKFFDSNEKKKYSLTLQDIEVLNYLYNSNDDYIYSYLFIDHRGRLYTKGNISYINSTLLRLLVKFDDYPLFKKDDFYKYYISLQLNSKIKSIKEGVNYYDNINRNEKINSVNYSKIEEFHSKTISLDATSSMLQIISLLTKNYKLMFFTNLIDHHEKIDIYDHIIDIIKKNIKKKNIFYKYYTSRKYVKYSIMLYIFGSHPLYTAKSLYEKHNVRTIHIKDLTTIIAYILKIFVEEFPVIKELISVMKKYIKRSMNEKNDIEVKTLLKKNKYTCPSIKNFRINYKNKVVFGVKVLSELPSKKKAIKSFFVNLIHSLDSEICILTRNDLLKKNIKSLSIHDCFIINIDDYKDCLSSYNNNLKKILEIEIDNLIPDFKKYINDKEYNKLLYFSTLDVEKYDNSNCFYSLKPE